MVIDREDGCSGCCAGLTRLFSLNLQIHLRYSYCLKVIADTFLIQAISTTTAPERTCPPLSNRHTAVPLSHIVLLRYCRLVPRKVQFPPTGSRTDVSTVEPLPHCSPPHTQRTILAVLTITSSQAMSVVMRPLCPKCSLALSVLCRGCSFVRSRFWNL